MNIASPKIWVFPDNEKAKEKNPVQHCGKIGGRWSEPGLFIYFAVQKFAMKRFIPSLILTLCVFQLNAQDTKKNQTFTDFANTIRKVVLAYRNNFSAIQGNPVSQDGNSNSFTSKVCITGAVSCEIRRYASVKDKSASWTCLLFEGDEFSEAAKVYRNTCTELKKTAIDIGGGQSLSFGGRISNPDENLRFTGTTLKAECKNTAFTNLIGGVELVNNYAGWEVRLNLYSGSIPRDEE